MLVRDLQRAIQDKLGARLVGGAKHDRFAVFDPAMPTRKLCTIPFSRGSASIDDDALLRHIAVDELHLPSLRHLKDLVGCSLDGPTALGLIREAALRPGK